MDLNKQHVDVELLAEFHRRVLSNEYSAHSILVLLDQAIEFYKERMLVVERDDLVLKYRAMAISLKNFKKILTPIVQQENEEEAVSPYTDSL